MDFIEVVIFVIIIICLFAIVFLVFGQEQIPTTISGGSAVLELMMRKRYDALSKLFNNTSIDYESFKNMNKQYRNEVDLFIDNLKLNMSHHSAGDKFFEPTNRYYMEDDVVGLNNYLGLNDFLNVPPNINDYVLVAVITKTYKVIMVNYETYDYPHIIPMYDENKKSFPYYLHAMYERREGARKIITNSGKWIEPKIRTFPHYGADCVFNSYVSMLSLCTDIVDPRFIKVMNESNTTELEKEFGYDYHDPFDINDIINENTYDKNKWLITKEYINGKTNLKEISELVKQNGYELVGAMLMVSRIGNWNRFFHQITYSMEEYIADDMTYNPNKVSPEKIDEITLGVSCILLRRCKHNYQQ